MDDRDGLLLRIGHCRDETMWVIASTSISLRLKQLVVGGVVVVGSASVGIYFLVKHIGKKVADQKISLRDSSEIHLCSAIM